MTNDKIEEIIKEATNRFLRWKLPDTFRPDGGISYDPNVCETVGTHVFTAQEATEMFRFCLEDTITTFADEIRKVAYEAGVKAERERVMKWAKKQYFATTADGKRVILNNTPVDFLFDNK
jgi:hypothetical protein